MNLATVHPAGDDAHRTGVPTWPLACVVAGAFAPAALTRGTGRARLCIPALAMFWMPVLGVYRRHGQLRALDRHAVACLHPRSAGGGLPGSFRRALAGTVARCGVGAGVLAAVVDVGLGRLGVPPRVVIGAALVLAVLVTGTGAVHLARREVTRAGIGGAVRTLTELGHTGVWEAVNVAAEPKGEGHGGRLFDRLTDITIVLVPRDDQARRFYERQRFRPVPDGSGALYRAGTRPNSPPIQPGPAP